jgi:enamine deaminase RidA (YjgF/YER057c/UK114 family)
VGAPGAPIEEQAAVALAEVDRLLEACGSDKSRILSATIWLADMTDFAGMNAVWEKWMDPDNPPARATGEARLASPDYKFEVIIVAAE